MIDTHCHLNFSSFKKNLDFVIQSAQENGVNEMIVVGTDVKSSKKAVEIAEKHKGIYAAVGIHPHHVYELITQMSNVKGQIQMSNVKTANLLSSPKVVAIGEVGMDKHPYQKTKYENYHINSEFIGLQKQLFIEQIKLAIQYKKSLIVHNREARNEVLEILEEYWDIHLEGRTVFHCCEPDVGTTLGLSLLNFAKKHHVFIGVDGDVTYSKEKQEFVKKIPLDLLVLETDSPFLLPEPLRSQKKYPNEPKNINLINCCIAKLLGIDKELLGRKTTANAKALFTLEVRNMK